MKNNRIKINGIEYELKEIKKVNKFPFKSYKGFLKHIYDNTMGRFVWLANDCIYGDSVDYLEKSYQIEKLVVGKNHNSVQKVIFYSQLRLFADYVNQTELKLGEDAYTFRLHHDDEIVVVRRKVDGFGIFFGLQEDANEAICLFGEEQIKKFIKV